MKSRSSLASVFCAIMAALFLLPAVVEAGSRRAPMAGVSFHIETEEGENPKMVFSQYVNGKERPFRRIPEATAKDIASFNAFPSREGEGYGLAFQLKPGPTNRIAAITAANQGRWLVARLNGRVIDAVYIDKQISDGILVIWKGVSAGEVEGLDKKLPRFGEKKPRGR